MKNIAIIPARSGSKGLKDKNIKDLCGKPMLAYSVEEAIKSKQFDVVHVSTDSEEYAGIARKYGADVPFLRSNILSNDTATTRDAMCFVLREYERMGQRFDTITILQPTSPLRKAIDIKIAFQIFKEKDANAVVSVCEADHSPLWTNTIGENLDMTGFISPIAINAPRQKLSTYYRLNGAIYLSKVDYYKTEPNIYAEKCFACIMPKERSVDIDDIFDYTMAKALMEMEE